MWKKEKTEDISQGQTNVNKCIKTKASQSAYNKGIIMYDV